MAGVETSKSTIKNVGQMKSHYDEEKRLTNNHRNKHIDKSKTPLNYNLGASSWREMMKACKEEVKLQDKLCPPKRKKNDRKDMYTLIIYCPEELERRNKEFFEKFYEKYEEAFPGSLKGIQVHLDEQHNYIDPDTKEERKSLIHGHCFGVPISEKGCNMKSFMNRQYFVKVNAICSEIAKEMGANYHTGKGHHQSKKVEDMKLASARALDEKIESQKDELMTLQIANQEARTEKTKLDKDVAALKNDKQSIIANIWNEVKNLWLSFKDQETRQKRLEAQIKTRMVFGQANTHKSNFKGEMGRINEDSEPKTIQATLKAADKEFEAYKSSLDTIEKNFQEDEDLLPDDDFSR